MDIRKKQRGTFTEGYIDGWQRTTKQNDVPKLALYAIPPRKTPYQFGFEMGTQHGLVETRAAHAPAEKLFGRPIPKSNGSL
jgi:hypothetical protein